MRPILSPASRRLWRDPATLQLGRAGPGSCVLTGLDPTTRAVLALLDGTRDTAQVERQAAELGCHPARTTALLALLRSAGLLHDATERWPPALAVDERERLAPDVASLGLTTGGAGLPVLRRRQQAQVVVLGAGRVGAPLAGLLAAGGVGAVDVVDDGTARAADLAVGGLRPADLGRRRGEAARDRLRELAPSTRSGPVPRPDLAVLAPRGPVDDADAAALVRAGVPHLLAEVRDAVGVVGPLVLPGSSACLRCQDLSRTDDDPGWPAVAVQLSAAPRRSPAPCDAVLAAAVAAQAALQVLAHLDGAAPASLGGSLELELPDWRWRRRSWAPHPACSCRWPEAG